MTTQEKTRQAEDLKTAERWISFVLRGGVLLSGFVLVVGLVLTWTRPLELAKLQKQLPGLLSGEVTAPLPVRSLSTFVTELIALNPATVTSLGVLILILLPVARVLLTVFVFLKERDYVFLGITAFVFSVLVFGLIFGKSL